jgi:hypothetical protein
MVGGGAMKVAEDIRRVGGADEVTDSLEFEDGLDLDSVVVECCPARVMSQLLKLTETRPCR